jgi:hypothetical protein
LALFAFSNSLSRLFLSLKYPLATYRTLVRSTLPPLFWFLFELKKDGALEDEKFTGHGSNPRAVDTWRDGSRWRRGIFTGRWYVKIFMFVIFLASLACAGLGFWGTFDITLNLLRTL